MKVRSSEGLPLELHLFLSRKRLELTEEEFLFIKSRTHIVLIIQGTNLISDV